jgi:hypothetical protein
MAMKRLISLLVLAAAGLAAGAFLGVRYQSARSAAELAAERKLWDGEKAGLEALLAKVRADTRSAAGHLVLSAPSSPAGGPSPSDILKRLQGLQAEGASANPARLRGAVYLLEELVHAGNSALPAIREFLLRSEDIEFDPAWGQSRTARTGKLPGDFVLPPSIRFGLFDVLRRIGSAEAEKLLGEMLNDTGRGLEVAYLTRLLHEMAPGKYRAPALSAAKTLLGAAPLEGSATLDRYHREYLFAVLSFYGDTSFAGEAQGQLIRSDHQIDRGALQYLQQTMGAQSVGIAAQTYQNPLIQSNAPAKEPLARLALHFAGADTQANEFYQRAINDPVLTSSHRSNLIEDLNEDGFPDPKNLTPNDLPLIQNRLALIEQLAPNAMDDVNAAAFKEAYKDLLNMRAKVTGQPRGTR